jgi:Tfp pilus assembly pilus retraction ATPase PilT
MQITSQIFARLVEVLRCDSATAKSILERRIADIADDITTGQRGMRTFDAHLLQLYQQGTIGGTQALSVATNVEALALAMRPPGQIRPG